MPLPGPIDQNVTDGHEPSQHNQQRYPREALATFGTGDVGGHDDESSSESRLPVAVSLFLSPGAKDVSTISRLGRKKSAVGGSQFRQCPAAVAQSVLDPGAQLAERPVILRDQKERVVAEAARAAQLLDDHSVAAPFLGRLHLA